jgi:hypothetical protein
MKNPPESGDIVPAADFLNANIHIRRRVRAMDYDFGY